MTNIYIIMFKMSYKMRQSGTSIYYNIVVPPAACHFRPVQNCSKHVWWNGKSVGAFLVED